MKIVSCTKCGKKYRVVVIKYPCNMEDGRTWETYYTCPYCGETHSIRLLSNEDVKTEKVD